VQLLVEQLLDSGCNVQLRHEPKETSWDDLVDHGFIEIFDESEKLVLRRDGFQHNRKLRSGGARDAEAVKQVVDDTLKALPQKTTLPSFIESTFTTKVAYEDWLREHQATAGAAAA